jgi:GNAT superfamily N-acetyltransferase
VSLVLRNLVSVVDAAPADASALLGLWSALAARKSDGETTTHAVQEAAAAVARIAADPDQKLLVARIDDQVAGAVHLARAPLSPIHGDHAIFVMHLQVLEDFRRHGVGHALMEATVTWAEEKNTGHVVAAASVSSRDANRFMARLGLGQMAVVRGASTAALRAKLPVETPAAARVGSRTHRSVGHVVAQRRSLRRAQRRPT